MSTKGSWYGWVVVGLLFANIMFGFLGMQSIAVLFPAIAEDFTMSMAQMGAAIGVFNLASPIFTPLGGALADRHGCRSVLGVSFLILCLASALRFYVDSANMLIGCMFLYGVGFAPIGAVVPKALSNFFPPQQLGKANGVTFAAFGVGGTLAFAITATVLLPAMGGWRATMLLFAALSLIAVVAWIAIYRDPAEAIGRSGGENMLESFKQVLAIRDIWLLSLTYAFVMLGCWTIIALLPSQLGSRGLSPQTAQWMMLTAVVFNIVGGMVSDHLGRRKPVLIACAVALTIALPLMVVAQGSLLIVALILAGMCFGSIIPVASAVPVEIKAVGPALAGTGVGVMFMIGNTGGFAGPFISGWLIDSFGTPWAGYGFVTIAAFVAIFIAVKMGETGRAAQG